MTIKVGLDLEVVWFYTKWFDTLGIVVGEPNIYFD